MTGNWWGELSFGYGFFGYSQSLNGAAESSIGNGSIMNFQMAGAYAFWLTPSFHGPKIITRLGYRTLNFSLPSSASNFTGETSFGSVFIGVGGELPIRDHFGAVMRLDLGLIKSGTQSGFVAGDTTGVTDVSFTVGGYYRWKQRLVIQVGFEVYENGLDLGSTSNVSHQSVLFVPSLLYYL